MPVALEVVVLALVVVHLLVAFGLPVLSRRYGRLAFFAGAVPPAASLVWAVLHAGAALSGRPPLEDVAWAPVLDLHLTFTLDPLALLMVLLVSGVGVLVLVYGAYYFDPAGDAAARTAALLVVFAGTMFGLVLADDLITLYVFWELTTICSFLLVGQGGVSREARRSALQALLLTTLGGLAMLLGFVLLGTTAGTYRISELVAHPPQGGATAAAAVLVLVGAFTKSAQMPFHNWLPAAMVAPTPVSAYLHAASMVKAGVFLIARLGPVFAGLGEWRTPALVLGLVTMILAGWRAMHEHDLKTLLAYGTVSQLGFLTVLMGAGTHAAALAGAGMLLAHGLFKSSLFLVVGIVDHQVGTRDVRELSGLGRRLPWVCATAVVAAASMAGLPPLVGFVAKEGAFYAFAHGGAQDALVLAGIVAGSVCTVAYTARFLWGAFARKPGLPDGGHVEVPAGGMVWPTVVPALAGLVFGLVYPVTENLAGGYAEVFEPAENPGHLALWSGFGLPLWCSLLALVLGVWLHLRRSALARVRGTLPRLVDAQRGYERTMATLERVAVGVTGRLQAGSLPAYMMIILLTVLVVEDSALLAGGSFPSVPRAWDEPMQVPLALVVAVAAVAVTMARRRLTAVVLVGVVGYGIGGLFIVDGGPDLALTQFLVETLTLVAFVFVLRWMPPRFNQQRQTRALRVPKMLVAVAAGALMSVCALVFSSVRTAPPVATQEYLARAPEGAGATNVVNAILVDFRAFDTVGESVVLAVAATGVASLVLAPRQRGRRGGGPERPERDTDVEDGAAEEPAAGAAATLAAGSGEPRSGVDDPGRGNDE